MSMKLIHIHTIDILQFETTYSCQQKFTLNVIFECFYPQERKIKLVFQCKLEF